jgi:hypothetical protein
VIGLFLYPTSFLVVAGPDPIRGYVCALVAIAPPYGEDWPQHEPSGLDRLFTPRRETLDRRRPRCYSNWVNGLIRVNYFSNPTAF